MDILVSVIVITYNSAQFVLETLGSIKDQTYTNIELIVSDDCSTDNTVQTVKDWIEQNKERFRNSCIVESEKNMGISANCNRGLNNANGKYVKIIAGDDLLLTNCIEDNVAFAIRDNIAFLFSRCRVFSSSDPEKKMVEYYSKMQDQIVNKFSMNVEKQYQQLLRENFVFAPSGFLNREVLIFLGGFDEHYIFMEDYPLWIKATKNKIKLYFMPIDTVLYRIENNSAISFSNNENLYKKAFFDDAYNIYYRLRHPYLNHLYRIDKQIEFYIMKKVVNGKNTKKEYRKLSILKLLSPLFYYKTICKISQLWK